jgi:hypothetical protein
MQVRTNALRAVSSWGREVINFAGFALVGNPPQLSTVVLSAALGLLLDLLPLRHAVLSSSLGFDQGRQPGLEFPCLE